MTLTPKKIKRRKTTMTTSSSSSSSTRAKDKPKIIQKQLEKYLDN